MEGWCCGHQPSSSHTKHTPRHHPVTQSTKAPKQENKAKKTHHEEALERELEVGVLRQPAAGAVLVPCCCGCCGWWGWWGLRVGRIDGHVLTRVHTHTYEPTNPLPPVLLTHARAPRSRRKSTNKPLCFYQQPPFPTSQIQAINPRPCLLPLPRTLVRPEVVVDLLPLRDVVVVVGPQHQHHRQRDVVVDNAVHVGGFVGWCCW